MRALIEPGGRVAEIREDGDDFPVAPPLEWIDCGEDVTTDHRWDGEQFIDSRPTPPTDAEIAANELRAGGAAMDLLEDLMDTLAEKGVLVESELPAAAREQLQHRRDLRAQVRGDG